MKNLLKQVYKSIYLLVIFACSALASDVPTISQQQVLSLIQAPQSQDFVIVDVRSAEEFNERHLEGAINISHDTIGDKLGTLDAYKDKLVIVHCRSGRRAQVAEEILLSNGFSNVKHLEGDMKGWLKADLPTVNN
ncbi:rhodanese-like domain-containing protein [Thalassotalea ganghwensis]